MYTRKEFRQSRSPRGRLLTSYRVYGEMNEDSFEGRCDVTLPEISRGIFVFFLLHTPFIP